MTLGQEFSAFATTIREDIARLIDAVDLLTDVNLGGTAIGTRINADPTYGPIAISELSALCGVPLPNPAIFYRPAGIWALLSCFRQC